MLQYRILLNFTFTQINKSNNNDSISIKFPFPKNYNTQFQTVDNFVKTNSNKLCRAQFHSRLFVNLNQSEISVGQQTHIANKYN